MIDEIDTVAVVGAGTMGHGIAEVAALSGYDVTLRDVDEEAVRAGYENIEASLQKLHRKGTIPDTEAVLSRITPLVSVDESVTDADVVIEAVPERFDIKTAVWEDVERAAPADAVLATNTSSISISRLAAVIDQPQRFVGMHFFQPPVLMDLVEIVPGEGTDESVLDVTERLASDMGKTPVVIGADSPGFVSNRMIMPFINEACWVLEHEIDDPRRIDAIKHEYDLPLGPLELADFTGLDVVLDILEYLNEELGPAYEPAPPLVDLVDDGDLGQKSGSGFYEHPTDGRIPESESPPLERVFSTLVNEGSKLVEEGVSTPADIDTVMELGLSFPRGPMEFADERGIDTYVRELSRLHGEYGHPRYELSEYLRRTAETDSTLY